MPQSREVTAGPRVLSIGIAIALAGSSLIAGFSGAGGQPATAAERGSGKDGGRQRPNVLVVLTDDQRDRGTMGVMKETRRLFEDSGVDFSNAFSTTPVCCPSRATVFTGQYAHNHGVLTNGESDLPQSETIQRYLNKAGYQTGIFGKYLNAWGIEDSPPHFDKWAMFKNSSRVYGQTTWNVRGNLMEISDHPARFIQRRAVGFLKNYTEEQDGKPWFMFLAPPNPHLPAKTEKKYKDAEVPEFNPNPAVKEKNRKDKPPYVRKRSSSQRRARKISRRQLRSLLPVDDLVKRITGRMERLDETRNTLVFYLSDNGFMWSEHKMLGSLRSKQNPYADSVQIPMFLRWPKKIGKSRSDARYVSTVDVAPTIMHAANLHTDPGHPMDGRSLLRRSWNRRKVFLEFFPTPKVKIPQWKSVRTPKYQYVEYYDDDGEVSFREYYDMKNDVWQLRNVFKDGDPSNDPNETRLSNRIDRFEDCVGNGCP